MTVYSEIITSAKEIKTIAQHLSSIGKLRAKTEDTTLVQLIDFLTGELQQAHATSKSKSTPLALSASHARSVTDLLKYCQRATRTKKPEWQILAERNGWSPPNG
jgi:hypothetical protein